MPIIHWAVQVRSVPKSSADAQVRVAESLRQAAAASDAHQAQNLQRVGSGTGDILRTNFLLLVDSVTQHDGHLLAAEELHKLSSFKARLQARLQFLCVQLV